jgi:uncharacterized delta-60 repeat protein
MWLFSCRKARRTAPARRPSAYRPRLEVLEDRCVPSSGALDPTFGSGGTVTTTLNNLEDFAHGLLLQSNGDLIAYGGTSTTLHTDERYAGFGLARYTPSGSLDPTFGTGGIVKTFKIGTTSIAQLEANAAPEYPYGVTQAALQSDGKIVAVGGASYLVRYNSNGSVDTTFGVMGLVTVPSGFSVASVLIEPGNGAIVVGGRYNSALAMLRYTPTGTLDSTFGSGGEVVTSIVGGNGGNGYRTPLALENGDIVVGGGGTTDFALARYTLSGSLDTTFGSGGIVTTAMGSEPYISNLLVQPNGQIVAVGTLGALGGNWKLARYNLNGSLDSTFGSGGIVTTNITGADWTDNAALQTNGQIVVVGWSDNPLIHFDIGVYNTNGSLDTSFGSGGIVTQPWSDTDGIDAGGGVIVQPDGKIVTASSTYVVVVSGKNRSLQWDFMLARYGPSAAQIGSFTASPNPVTSGSSLTLTASNITLADPSSTITQVAFYVQMGGTNTLLGYGTQSAGVWTFTYTVNLTPSSYTLIAQATDSDGVLGDPLALTLQVM